MSTGTATHVGAIVLGGGRSSRFGSDKLAVEVDGIPLLQHALLAAAAFSAQVVLVGPPSNSPAGVVVVREDPPYAGPYAAVACGLDALEASIDVVLVLAGDLRDPGPLLPRLLGALEAEHEGRRPEAAVAIDPEGHRQPLLAAYRVGPLVAGMAGVDTFGRSAYALLDGLRVVTVDDSEGRHSRDVDTPDDLA